MRRSWEPREESPIRPQEEAPFDGDSAAGDDVERAELLEPGTEIVAGRRPVEEAFAARREARRLIVVPQRRAALEALVLHATTLRIPVIEVEGGTLTSIAGFDGHQGVALVVGARPLATLDDVLARAAERQEPPFVLVLDSLEDPQNFGTVLRTAEAAGVHGVVYPTHHAAPLSPAAVKASAGAVEHLLLVPVDDLPGALSDAHTRGLRIVGAEAQAPLSFRDADLRGPLALVVGSEGQGVSGAVRRRLDVAVSIPMTGRVASLNAAVAGSVLLVEAALQRSTSGTSVAATDTVAPDGEVSTTSGGTVAEDAPGALEPTPKRRTKSTASRATGARTTRSAPRRTPRDAAGTGRDDPEAVTEPQSKTTESGDEPEPAELLPE